MFTNGQSLNQSVALMTDILTGYDRRHRPIEDQSQPIQVSDLFQNKYMHLIITERNEYFTVCTEQVRCP